MTILVAAALPVAVLGTAALAAYLTYLRMKVTVARQQEAIASSRAHALMRDMVAVERMRASEEAARSKALNDVLSSLRVEERTLRRTDGRPIAGTRKPVILEERFCLGRLPLSSWARQELSVYAGVYAGAPMSPMTPETYPKPKLLGWERR